MDTTRTTVTHNGQVEVAGVIAETDHFLRMLRESLDSNGLSCAPCKVETGESSGTVLMSNISAKGGLGVGLGTVSQTHTATVWNPFVVSLKDSTDYKATVTVRRERAFQQQCGDRTLSVQDVRIVSEVRGKESHAGIGCLACLGSFIVLVALNRILSPILLGFIDKHHPGAVVEFLVLVFFGPFLGDEAGCWGLISFILALIILTSIIYLLSTKRYEEKDAAKADAQQKSVAQKIKAAIEAVQAQPELFLPRDSADSVPS